MYVNEIAKLQYCWVDQHKNLCVYVYFSSVNISILCLNTIEGSLVEFKVLKGQKN